MAGAFTDGSEKYSTRHSGAINGVLASFRKFSLDDEKFAYKWAGGKVPYSISPEVRKNDAMCVRINNAVETFNSQVRYVTWKDRSSFYDAKDYVMFKVGESTRANVGCLEHGEQSIWLADNNSRVGNILHEMGHAVGLLHEHSRLDRDNYVKVYSAVHSDKNYKKDAVPIGPYDMDSIMHYPEIKGKMETCCRSAVVGQRDRLSESDIRAIDFLYHSGVCTFDHFGENYWPQEWAECYTCWGGESNYGCCTHCAMTCHKGHHLKWHDIRSNADSNEVFVCDCGRYCHKQPVCTWYSTKSKFVKQPFYKCNDCFSKYGEGCCYQCMLHCHKGHNVDFDGISPGAFCDCGLKTSSCCISCKLPKP